MTNDLPFFLDPFNPKSDLFFGRADDGTINVTVKLAFRVPDEVGLRSAHLMDPSAGDVAPDWGVEAAAMRVVSEVVRTAPWRKHGLEPVEAKLRGGVSAAGIPEGQFAE
jgi:hypothetical protein